MEDEICCYQFPEMQLKSIALHPEKPQKLKRFDIKETVALFLTSKTVNYSPVQLFVLSIHVTIRFQGIL